MPTFTLYSQPGCMPCRGVKREMDQVGVDYVVRDITADDAARQAVIDLGYQGTPVVVASTGEHWHGHRPGRIQSIVATQAA